MKYTIHVRFVLSDNKWNLSIITIEDEGPNREGGIIDAKQLMKADRIFKTAMIVDGTNPDGNILTGHTMVKTLLREWLNL